MKIKTVLATTIPLLVALSVSAAHAASWSPARTLSQVYIRTNSGTPELRVISAEGAWSAGGCSSSVAKRKADDREQDHFLKMALAAYLSGKRISVYVDGNCTLSRMQIKG